MGFPKLPISFTAYKSTDVLSKRFHLDGNGNVVKTPAAQMVRGTARRIAVDFSIFGNHLTDADERTAFGYGLHDEAFGEKVEIILKGRESSRAISRTKDYFKYCPSPGIVMLDHDPHPRGQTVTVEQLQAILSEIIPGCSEAACWTRGSLSAGVHRSGDLPHLGKGFHVYLPVVDASDIPRFGAVLFKRLWLAGYGYITFSSAGTFLTRSIVDPTVFSPERLDFTGRPVVGKGLEWTPPEPIYKQGGYLDTRLLPDLTGGEVRR